MGSLLKYFFVLLTKWEPCLKDFVDEMMTSISIKGVSPSDVSLRNSFMTGDDVGAEVLGSDQN